MTEPIVHRVRKAAGEPEGLLVLFHGRGADENDLFPLFDMLDPQDRYLGVTPRGPLSLPPGGAHWYAVFRVGFPDPATFGPTFESVSSWLDDLVAETGIPWERVVLGGFSQGAVMTYSLGLATGRPRPAGLICLSGFMPEVEGLEFDLEPRGTRIAIGHGTHDQVISVDFSRAAHERLEAAGFDLLYKESPMPHTIDPSFVDDLREWLPQTLDRAVT